MERLILQYSQSDGYTYSSEITLPLTYKSKEDAINDLTSILIEYDLKLEQYRTKFNELENNFQEISNKITKLNRTNKKKLNLEQDSLHEQLNGALKNCTEHVKHLPTEFKFSNLDLQYEDFFYNSHNGNKEISLPNILTLDEFFSEAK